MSSRTAQPTSGLAPASTRRRGGGWGIWLGVLAVVSLSVGGGLFLLTFGAAVYRGDALLVHGTLPPAHVRTRPFYRNRHLAKRAATAVGEEGRMT